MPLPSRQSTWIHQEPSPDQKLLRFRGDTQTFVLTLAQDVRGQAWLRTTIGQGCIQRNEIIRGVHHEHPRLGHAWFDIPMVRLDARRFHLTLPLDEVGHFEAKCFLLPQGESIPIWPEGPNTVINVAPADMCCGNTVYNTFVRQFGPNKQGRSIDAAQETCINSLDAKKYTVIPPSGTFRDLIAELDFIIGHLGCRFIQLLPIHPTPTTYARMGRFGSPYAALSFTAVDPALAVFDPKATPLEQFIELVDAVHSRNGKLIIDIAINHTGWAADLHERHPQWLSRDPEGRIEAPGAWGVVWADLTKLEYTHRDLWAYMADVLLTWCRRGIDGFRCDAGYMIPVEAWEYLIARVRDQYPDTLFLLEGLGGKVSVTRDLLDRANFDWAYSELFQNYDQQQITHYLPEALRISAGEGVMIHFAETHDNNRLAATSKAYARMRTALSALASVNGAFAFAGGVEWYATEKINVHEATSLNWGAPDNQVDWIKRLTTLLKIHAAFHDQSDIHLIPAEGANQLVLLRHHRPTGKKLLILTNLDHLRPQQGLWQQPDLITGSEGWTDLLSGRPVALAWKKGACTLPLEPAQVLCLTDDPQDLERLQAAESGPLLRPVRSRLQRLRAKVLDVHRACRGVGHLGDLDVDAAAQALAQDPMAFCRSLNGADTEPRVIPWQWPADTRRNVMVPPGHFLLIRSPEPFRARILNAHSNGHGDDQVARACEESLRDSEGIHFALFSPLPTPQAHQQHQLHISVFSGDTAQHAQSPLLYLAAAEDLVLKRVYSRSELLHQPLLFLGTNGRGAMLRAHLEWGRLDSKYDALLAANLNEDFPEDRRVLLARCRAWVVFQGFSQAIDLNCLHAFTLEPDGHGIWQYKVPTGQGQHILMDIHLKMLSGENALQLAFHRPAAEDDPALLADDKPVRLIVRPDIENRSFHELTKAYLGPENAWPNAIDAGADRFHFRLDPTRELLFQIRNGAFVWEPEWYYMVYRQKDTERGQDPHSDLFSPGYVYASMTGGGTVLLGAGVQETSAGRDFRFHPLPEVSQTLQERPGADTIGAPDGLMAAAMEQFVVNRKPYKTVIAGYPWFLDWGRDSLIVVRGLIEAGRIEEARAVLTQFGRYEEDGTLPNMIHGDNAGNRDTSDAPLWFFLACGELLHRQGDPEILNADCGGRSLRRILLSIGRHYVQGTPNGIRMDADSGLIYSPAHFTWMDTDYPAGTPRRGYPVELQALWHYALNLLAKIDESAPKKYWRRMAGTVAQSIRNLFFLTPEGFLADCLHADAGVPAAQAEADDCLRPNQLFAVTLGAVSDRRHCEGILAACRDLLVPGGIRSLADRPLNRRPLEIRHNETLLGDPLRPYRGAYTGDEDTARKPAYHNGTAWTWVFPSFCEAWVKVYGPSARETALAWLSGSAGIINTGCVGHVPEILDGDAPHHQRGCDAQAWGASEWLRVWLKFTKE